MKWLRFLQRALRPSGGTDLAYREKRDTWRVFHEMRLEALQASGERIALRSVNFGPGGLGAQSDHVFRKRDTVTLILEKPGVLAQTSARVVWVASPRDDDETQVGFHFVSSAVGKPRDFVQVLLEDCSLTIQSPQERRRAPRVQVDMLSAEVVVPDEPPVHARVADLSVGGALLLSDHEIGRGTTCTVRIRPRELDEPLVFQARIIREGKTGQLQTLQLSMQFLEVTEAQRTQLGALVTSLLQPDD